MEQAGVSEAAILSFQRNYEILAAGSSTDITEDSIEPVEKLPELEEFSQEMRWVIKYYRITSFSG